VSGHRRRSQEDIPGGATNAGQVDAEVWCPEAHPVRQWARVCGQGGAIMAGKLDVQTLFIEPGSPWENGDIESFNGKLRDERLNGEVFSSVPEAKVLTDAWRQYYNHHRPHSALGYRPPAPVVIKPKLTATP